MFCVEIAGVTIGIDNRYALLKWLCRKYIKKGVHPAFTVKASDEMLMNEFSSILDHRLDLASSEQKELRTALRMETPPTNEHEYQENICLTGEKPTIPLGTWCYLEELSVYRQICHQLIHFDAFVLHASVIAINGEAVAFVGKHGAGKTTRLELWKSSFGDSAIIVNGDKPIIRQIDDTLYACGTPWNGKENLGINCMVPLTVLCFVERSTRVQLHRLRSDEIIHRLFNNTLIPDNREDLNRLCGLINILIEQVPCFLLECSVEKGEDPVKIWSQIKQETIIR